MTFCVWKQKGFCRDLSKNKELFWWKEKYEIFDEKKNTSNFSGKKNSTFLCEKRDS
jgi:hypothetical protein